MSFEDVDPWARPIPVSFDDSLSRRARSQHIEKFLQASISLRRAKQDIRATVLQRTGDGQCVDDNTTMENTIVALLREKGWDKPLRNAIFKLHHAGISSSQLRRHFADSSGGSNRGINTEGFLLNGAPRQQVADDLSGEGGMAIHCLNQGQSPRRGGQARRGADGSNSRSQHHHRSQQNQTHSSDQNDPVSPVESVRRHWENSINEELLAISKERGQPLIRPRSRLLGDSDDDSMRGDGKAGGAVGGVGGEATDVPSAGGVGGSGSGSDDGDVGGNQAPGSHLRFLYDSEDLLDTIRQLESDSREGVLAGSLWGLVRVTLPTPMPTMQQLQHTFQELSPQCHQVGVDDQLHLLLSSTGQSLKPPAPARPGGLREQYLHIPTGIQMPNSTIAATGTNSGSVPDRDATLGSSPGQPQQPQAGDNQSNGNHSNVLQSNGGLEEKEKDRLSSLQAASSQFQSQNNQPHGTESHGSESQLQSNGIHSHHQAAAHQALASTQMSRAVQASSASAVDSLDRESVFSAITDGKIFMDRQHLRSILRLPPKPVEPLSAPP